VKDTLEQYRVLGVEPGASAKKIRSAYLELVRTWDPERYVDNPVLREEAEEKRKEIEEAYQAIRFFLPELQGPPDETEKPRFRRDFKEMAVDPRVERTRTVMGILVLIILLMIFGWAVYLLVKGHGVTPAFPVPLE
jgi:DnaJ-like protein